MGSRGWVSRVLDEVLEGVREMSEERCWKIVLGMLCGVRTQ